MFNLPQINFSSNLAWIATILAGLIGGASTMYVYFKSKEKKEISYSLVANNYVASVYEELPILHKIKISVGEKNVKNIRFVLFRIQNTGNVSISSDDIEQPICFVSSELIASQQLIGGYISETMPQNTLASVISYDDLGMVGLSKFTINKGDRIDVALLFADYDDAINPVGRIKGGTFKYSEVQNLQTTFWSRTWVVWAIIHFVLSVLLSLSLLLFSGVNPVKTFIIILLTLLIPTYSFIVINKFRKRNTK